MSVNLSEACSATVSPPECVLLPCRALADTRQIGKLSREQFALAMHLIQQKVSKGIDPPQALTADMIPPSERGTPVPVGLAYPTVNIYSVLYYGFYMF